MPYSKAQPLMIPRFGLIVPDTVAEESVTELEGPVLTVGASCGEPGGSDAGPGSGWGESSTGAPAPG